MCNLKKIINKPLLTNNIKFSKLDYCIFRTLLAVSSGASGTLAFSPYNLWPVAILSLTGLLLVTLNCNDKQASYFSFFWGAGLFSTGINWIYDSINQFGNTSKLFNTILLALFVIYLTLYPIIFSVLLVRIWPSTTYCRLIFAAPILWSFTEFLRSHLFSGFPWLQFGYSQVNSPFKGLAPILGVEGVTFILMLISGLLTFILTKKCSVLIVTNTMLFLFFLWTLQFIHWYRLNHQRKITITLVQGNIEQAVKWNLEYISQVLNTYLKYTFKNIDTSQIIIWPESAIPDSEISQNIFLKKLDSILKKSNTSLITGIIDADSIVNNYKSYNCIIVIGNSSTPYYYLHSNRYIKYHLVPFGETVPFKKILKTFFSFFNFPFSCLAQGKYLQQQLVASNIKFTPSICYEIIFGSRIRNNFQKDTDCLLTISNNAWFGASIEAWQHLQMAQMRALELGRPLVHSTNNGITAFIKPDGKLQSNLPRFTEDELTNEIIPSIGLTPYARLGPRPLQAIILVFGIISIKYK